MDFNARSEDELLFKDFPVVESPLDSFLQELDIIFSTDQGSVFGQRGFGQSLEHLLWSTSINNEILQAKIKEAIIKWCSSAAEFSWSVKVSLLQGVSRDIGIIDVSVKNVEQTQLAIKSYVFK
jgi:hypothetical protein